MCGKCGDKRKCTCEIISCINPLIYLIKEAIDTTADSGNLATNITSLLDAGIIVKNGNLCCPDCTEDKGLYLLGTYSHLNTMHTLYNLQACCINFRLNTSDTLSYNAAFGASDIPCCNTNFSETITNLFSITTNDSTLISSGGIVEVSSFNGVSGLSIILDALSRITPALSSTIITNVFTAILNSGIVIKCKDCETYIGNVNNASIHFSDLGYL